RLTFAQRRCRTRPRRPGGGARAPRHRRRRAWPAERERGRDARAGARGRGQPRRLRILPRPLARIVGADALRHLQHPHHQPRCRAARPERAALLPRPHRRHPARARAGNGAGMAARAASPPAMTAQAAADVRGAFAARLIVLATLTFNMALAFANTPGLPIREAHVVAAELALVGCTFLLVWNRSEVFYVVAAAMGSWLVFAMVVRGEFDPKVLRDAFIPFLFYLL